jgi:SAM-dependent methyltransferase
MSGILSQSEAGRLVPGGFAPRRPLAEIVADLDYSADWNWSWNTYKDAIKQIAAEYGLRRHLEIGGGRDTLFTPLEAAAHGIDLTVNDISAKELELAPSAFRKVCCDVAAPDTMATIEPEAYDFVYSRMVMEHVRDSRQLWENQYAMLDDGGVALAFFPTLYAPAFALNRMVPESVSSAIVKRMFPDRHAEGDNPKFPAFYDNCYGSAEKVAPMLEEIGFRNVLVLPFYGYSYFWKLPVLKQVDAAFTRFVRERDWRTFTSFAYIIAEK